MSIINKIVGMGLLLAPLAQASALPPPVPVQIKILADTPEMAAGTERLVRALAADNWVATGIPEIVGAGYTACQAQEEGERRGCLSALVREEGPDAVLFIVHDPEWRGAQLQATCIGSDPAKTRIVDLHLQDAFHVKTEVANQVRREAASCLIGALHGTPIKG